MQTNNSTANLLQIIQDDMRQVDALIATSLNSGVPLVGTVAQHIITSGGKRLRPVLLLLTSAALGYQGEHRHSLAAVVEFIHTATLLHDDVVDESTLRRGNPTANAMFGNAASVLVGDFLYSRAFQMMVQANDMRILSTLADATNVIAEGEVLQLMNMHNADLDEAAYLQVIRSKTAKLFEASARVGALLAKANHVQEEAAATYGQALGSAFQIIDDILDYVGDQATLGKNLGDDLREGKCTLPLIAAMRLSSESDKALIQRAIQKGSVDDLPAIQRIVSTSGALDVAREVALDEANRAKTAALQLPSNKHQTALVELAEYLHSRTY